MKHSFKFKWVIMSIYSSTFIVKIILENNVLLTTLAGHRSFNHITRLHRHIKALTPFLWHISGCYQELCAVLIVSSRPPLTSALISFRFSLTSHYPLCLLLHAIYSIIKTTDLKDSPNLYHTVSQVKKTWTSMRNLNTYDIYVAKCTSQN